MLFKLVDHLRKTDNLKFPQKGTVVFNNDPKKIGRIKATVKGVFEELDTNKLPWVFPQMSSGLGGKNDSSSFLVPEIGSEVIVEFPFNDVYSPFYTGYWESSLVHKSIFDDNYPETYGFQDSTGNHIKINKTLNTAEVLHSSGTKITIHQDGKLEIFVQADQDITVTNNKNETVLSDKIETVGGVSSVVVTGDKTEESQAKNTIKGATIDIDDGTGATIPLNNWIICPLIGANHGKNQNVRCPA